MFQPYEISKIKDENEQVQEVIAKLPQYANLEYEDINKSDLPKGNRNKWRKNPAGGIKVDHSVVTPVERRQADKMALNAENKKAQPDMKVALDLLLKLQENNY